MTKVRKDQQRHLFEKEEETLKKAGIILESSRHNESPLFKEFSDLLDAYKKMYRQLRSLVRISDKQQLRLNKLNEKLDMRNRFIKTTFGQYLSDDIVKTILESPEGASLGGQKRVVTLLMSDIRGFTAISERYPAEVVVGMLNNYFEEMTEIIFKYKGVIDDFIGDGILVIFGSPLSQDDHPNRAIACAVEMQQAMEKVNRRSRESGHPEIEMGIGINTGELIVGNIGSPRRKKYGVVGSNVNLTARIEAYTVGGQVFISEGTHKACGPILQIIDQVDVSPKGVQKPITIYEIGGIQGDYNLYLPEKQEKQLVDLEDKLPVRFSILSGKHAGEKQYTGRLVRLLDREAEIAAHVNINKLANLKISIFDGRGNEIMADVYAKVIKIIGETPSLFRVNFTSVPPEAGTYLHSLVT